MSKPTLEVNQIIHKDEFTGFIRKIYQNINNETDYLYLIETDEDKLISVTEELLFQS